jgi:Fe-S cluster biogenesis protein NfuA/nitrite reductase/ring-hydroxylating ferredoxin subunit
VHGLHPYDVATRVGRALDEVRPYLGSHGGDVELLGMTDDGVVRLRLLGSCDNCSSSSVTLELAVKTAISAAAPEVTGIEVSTSKAASDGPLIAVSALWKKFDNQGPVAGGWRPLPDQGPSDDGAVIGYVIDDVALVVGRLGGELFAYIDECACCGGTLAGTRLERRLGAARGGAVLTCPSCRAHYDVRHAGVSLDVDDDSHLEPLPLLMRDGAVSVAVPVKAS